MTLQEKFELSLKLIKELDAEKLKIEGLKVVGFDDWSAKLTRPIYLKTERKMIVCTYAFRVGEDDKITVDGQEPGHKKETWHKSEDLEKFFDWLNKYLEKVLKKAEEAPA